MYGIVVAVGQTREEMAIEQVEGPWRRKDEEGYDKSVKAVCHRAIHGFEPRVNGKIGRLWVFAPVRDARERGENEEGVKKARKEFDRFVWQVGHEVQFKRRDGEDSDSSSVGSVGKWGGRSTYYRDDEYFY